MAERLHFTCPHCGGDFGWGDGAALLLVVSSASFDEPCPRCGKQLTGSVHRNGGIHFDPVQQEEDGQ